MDKEQVLKHTLELLDYIEKENYLGYDPYDFYLSPYAKYIPKSILFLHLQTKWDRKLNFSFVITNVNLQKQTFTKII